MLLQKTTNEQTKKKLWWCANCMEAVELNLHGRCRACGSDALDKLGRGGAPQTRVPVLAEASPAPGQGRRGDSFTA
jgi:ABC-type ATPase with predicted acetyltransferase domain